MKNTNDFVVIGAGLSGLTIARLLKDAGKNVTVYESRNHIGGNCSTYMSKTIEVHEHGPHIFHTSNKEVWDFVNAYSDVEPFTNCPIAIYKDDERYNLPINLYTIQQMFGNKVCNIPDKEIVSNDNPKNFEEKALSLVGKTIYEKLFKHYTEKSWLMDARELPADMLKRVPIRKHYDNNYYNDKYQGIPKYNDLFNNLSKGIEIVLNKEITKDTIENFLLNNINIIYTGSIDMLLDYRYGRLEYISRKFRHTLTPDTLFNAVVNLTSNETNVLRISDNKYWHRDTRDLEETILTFEKAEKYDGDNIPYYPLAWDPENKEMYEKYHKSLKYDGLYFLGRLATYSYKDMDKCIEDAFVLLDSIIRGEQI